MNHFVGFLFWGGAVGAWVRAGVLFAYAWRARAWPVVRGEVVAKNVFEDGSFNRSAFTAQLSYRYTVGSRVYFGTRRRVGGEMFQRTHGGASGELDGYRPGGAVRVHYDPRNPSVSLLDPGDLGMVGASVLGGMAAAAYGAYLVFLA